MADRLLIGVTGPSRGFRWAWWAIRWRLRRLGVAARYLTPQSGFPEGSFDGFIVSGGNDVDPAIYGGDVSHSPSVDTQRDRYELRILEEADRRAIPVFGICRGMQLMNVHADGSLIGDLKPIRKRTSNRATLLPRKHVDVRGDSLLKQWLGRGSTRVNSLHHQAVDRLGDGFVATSHDRDNIIQSIENVEGPLRIGVQWHPEYLPQRPEQRELFRRFVHACHTHRATRQAYAADAASDRRVARVAA